MDSKVFLRTLQWTLVGLCILFAVLYGWQYFYVGKQLPVIEKAPEFSMPNSSGVPVTMSKLDGKVRLVYFFFANCPDVCAPTTRKLATIQSKLFAAGYNPKDFQVISITIDPDNDTAAKLNTFAAKNNADLKNWSFLRTDLALIKQVAKAYGVGQVRDADNRLIHNNQVALVDRDGMIRKFYESGEIKSDTILADMKKLF